MGLRDKTIKALMKGFITVQVYGIVAAITAQFPFLSHPLSQQMLKHFFTHWITKGTTYTEAEAFFNYIDTRVGRQGNEFTNKAIANWEIQNNPNISKEEKLKAEQEFFNVAKNFIKFSS